MGNCIGICKQYKDNHQNQIDHQIKSCSNEEEKIEEAQIEKQTVKRGEKKQKLLLDKLPEEEVIYQNIVKRNRQLLPADMAFIFKALQKNSVFSQFSKQQISEIPKKMFYCETEEGEYVFRQKDKASSYFIIQKGQCQLIIDNISKKILKAGEGFGQLALLYGATRSASVKAVSVCALWGIDRLTFRNAVQQISQKNLQENRKFLNSVAIFSQLNQEQKQVVANILITQKYKKQNVIVQEGDQANSFYIIKKGHVKVIKNGVNIMTMGPNQTFGENSLISDHQKRNAKIIASDQEVICISVGRDTLSKILGDKIDVIINHNIQKFALQKDQILKDLTEMQIQRILINTKIFNFQKGQIILQKGLPCDKLIIPLSTAILKENQQTFVQKGKILGSNFLGVANFQAKFDSNLIAGSKGTVGIIQMDKFFYAVGGSQINKILQKNKKNYERIMKQKKLSFDHQRNQEIKFEDLIFIKRLGAGQFGQVYLVMNKKINDLYALKAIQKAGIQQQNLQTYIQQQKSVLQCVRYQFIMKYYRSFKDNNNIYFLTQYIDGVELFDAIRDIGILDIESSQFYVALMILSIQYMHSLSIIYRDIKPQNIMVDAEGYLKIIDMGTAKILYTKGGKRFRTNTIIGTPHYMAPQIISGKGYSYMVDLWSIGICLYEFICGGVPFAQQLDDPLQIYQEIINKQIIYPSTLKDKKTKKLIDQLLSKVPQVRLGGSYSSLKANPWFGNFNWQALEDRKMKAKYKPPKEKLLNLNELKRKQGQKICIVNFMKKQYKMSQNKGVYNWDKNY